MSDPIINKVAESGLVSIELEQFLPSEEIVSFDLKQFLFMGLILKEKDFRSALLQHDWSAYKGKIAAIHCSADAIIPVWAYMLSASYLQPVAADLSFGTPDDALKESLIKKMGAIDVTEYQDKRVVVKGCGEKKIEAYAYLEITKRLIPVAKSIMYGEPCSTVPIFKRK
jgi:hypothetical protein